MKKILREPLVQFLIVGAALFAASAFRPQQNLQRQDQIVVRAGQVEHLMARFTRTWRRPPTLQELQGLVDDFIREEVAVREGIAMGLDQDDSIIRRRIRQKLDFIAADVASLMEPSHEELEQYLAAHADDFRIEPRYTFLQVYLDRRKRGETIEAQALALLEMLQDDPDRDIRELGDPTLLAQAMQDVSEQYVANLFGAEFVTALMSLSWPVNDREPAVPRWAGPVHSSSGLHLVRLDKRTEGRTPALEEITEAVRREWSNAQSVEIKEKFYTDLLQQYEVTIEWPDDTMAGDQ